MIPCKDCLIFPMCLAFMGSDKLAFRDSILYIAHTKCSILRTYLYHVHPDHPEGLDLEKHRDISDYFYDFFKKA